MIYKNYIFILLDIFIIITSIIKNIQTYYLQLTKYIRIFSIFSSVFEIRLLYCFFLKKSILEIIDKWINSIFTNNSNAADVLNNNNNEYIAYYVDYID